MSKQVENIKTGQERAFYHSENTIFNKCTISGKEDGESAFKECRNIKLHECELCLRYPIWHAKKFEITNCLLHQDCRASLWYCKNGSIRATTIDAVKALRECSNVCIQNSNINSVEFGWKCRNISLENSKLTSEYAFFDSKNINLIHVDFAGKYSFQYIKNLTIYDSSFNTKDAFWHSKNVTVKNCYLKGEYLAWYSENLTLIDCVIEGTQPLCYCKNLKLINCQMINCDLCFEYSDVEATITSKIDSIKNPLSGTITCLRGTPIIYEDSIYPSKCKIEFSD